MAWQGLRGIQALCAAVCEVLGLDWCVAAALQGPLSPSGRTFREAAGEVDGGAGEGACAEARLGLSGRGPRNLRSEQRKVNFV